MTRHLAATGGSDNLYEEGVPYELTLKGVEEVPGKFGAQLKFVFGRPDLAGSGSAGDEWIFVSPYEGKYSLGKKAGRVSKLRGLANALLGQPEGAEIEWFDDETMGFKYPGVEIERRLSAGAKIMAKGELLEGADGQPRFRFNRFKALHRPEAVEPTPGPVTPKEGSQAVGAAVNGKKKLVAAGDIDPDDIPF